MPGPRDKEDLDTTWTAGSGGIASTRSQPAWRALGLSKLSPAGSATPFQERLEHLSPFATLDTVWSQTARQAAPVLIVMPMSGHFSWMLYDLVRALAAHHPVSVLDWNNARAVPMAAGPFGFEDSIMHILAALEKTGSGTHLVGLCQSAVPAIAATMALCQERHPAQPATLSLLGGPVAPDANPTRVSTLLAMTPPGWIEANLLAAVADDYPGAGRRVYPAETQQHGLLTYLARHYWQAGSLAEKITRDDGSAPATFPFLTLFTSVKDVPGEAFLESIIAVFQDQNLWRSGIRLRGQLLEPDAMRALPLLTIEAPMDDIVAPGQTRAAHDLLPGRSNRLSRHLLMTRGDHFSLFHGATCRGETVPALLRFMADAGR